MRSYEGYLFNFFRYEGDGGWVSVLLTYLLQINLIYKALLHTVQD